MGALLEMYGIVDVAFIGGSLQDTGRPQPCRTRGTRSTDAHGTGPNEFRGKCADGFTESGCLTTAHDSEELAFELLQLLNDADLRQRQGDAARQVVDENRGAALRQFNIVREWLNAAS